MGRIVTLATAPFRWAVHLLGHAYPAEHPGCSRCRKIAEGSV